MSTEWTVVTVLAVLVGLFLSVGKPIINLNSNITKLNTNLENIQKQQDKYEKDNEHEHDRIWKNLNEKDKAISKHSMRLHDLDGKTDE